MISGPDRPPLELWGGVECTVNRVGDRYVDQLELNGHATRLDDLDRFADLGIRALRYPILWERTAPDGPERADWRWADERLGRLRQLGIRPIVGLVHHGSGPRWTSLVEPSFVDGLAVYAGAVAARFPWIEEWTPVNEPLTTARFSGLYGHWYPHGRDELLFARALLVQCRAVAAAMRAIRRVNPAARLVQTEDLGKVWSTPALRFQADFENERRWISFDLLCGRVDRHHWMWQHLRWLGIAEEELTPFLDEPCPPDVVGVNHYLTSERFLDERLDRYPPHTHGGNEHRAYADIEAVRVLAAGPGGPEALLREVWERYRLPIAVTEAHLGCTREEQLRWFKQVWDAAHALRAAGADVRAVTAWSLLGAYDWDSLLTCAAGHYEPGVFDLRAPRPRPTALAGLLRDLAAGREPDHPVLGTPGWWLRPQRLLYRPVRRRGDDATPSTAADKATPRAAAAPVLIVGARGALTEAFARFCDVRAIPCRHPGHDEWNPLDPGAVERALAAHRPWAVIDATAPGDDAGRTETRVDRARVLAEVCAQRAIPLLTFSSGRVFDGAKASPYLESDPASPSTAAGEIDATAEARALTAHPGTLVVRVGSLFDPWHEDHAAAEALRAMAAGEPVAAAEAILGSLSYVPDLVQACLNLLIDGERGIWHLANAGVMTGVEFARRLAMLAGSDGSSVVPSELASREGDAGRAATPVLGSERGWPMPALDDALARYVAERAPGPVLGKADGQHEVAAVEAPVELLGWGGRKRTRRVS